MTGDKTYEFLEFLDCHKLMQLEFLTLALPSYLFHE